MEIKDIEKMNYSEFVALTKERNRPSGGIKTVHNIAVNALIGSDKKMLEIGSNTGFTCVNMSLLTGCECVGIDINENSIKEAKIYAEEQGIKNKVSFLKTNAENLPFENESFDIVWCSNVTSFIKDKEKAIMEYLRVLKTGGTLVVVPIDYIKNPPEKIVSEISKAIGTEIEVWDKPFWINLFDKISEDCNIPIELYYSKDFIYEDREEFIQNYTEVILNKTHLKDLSKEVKYKIKEKYENFIRLFNENLKYAGYSILLYQKRKTKEEIELFLTKEK